MLSSQQHQVRCLSQTVHVLLISDGVKNSNEDLWPVMHLISSHLSSSVILFYYICFMAPAIKNVPQGRKYKTEVFPKIKC